LCCSGADPVFVVLVAEDQPYRIRVPVEAANACLLQSRQQRRRAGEEKLVGLGGIADEPAQRWRAGLREQLAEPVLPPADPQPEIVLQQGEDLHLGQPPLGLLLSARPLEAMETCNRL